MFNDKNTFWGKHKNQLMYLEREFEFPDNAYHEFAWYDSGYNGLYDDRIIGLKRKYLNRLRQTLLRLFRQKKDASNYTLPKNKNKGRIDMVAWIKMHTEEYNKEHGIDG